MPSYTAQPLWAAPGPVPPPTGGPTEQMEPQLDPTGQKPHGYYRECFFGTLAPVSKEIEWHSHRNVVSLRILEADEARQCARYAFVRAEGHVETEDYLLARTIFHIALCLESVDGKPIGDECKTFEQRLQLAAELAETLQDAIINAYHEARLEPIAFLQEMAEQADFSAGTPTPSGLSREPEVSPSMG